jgi:hypothetical protein
MRVWAKICCYVALGFQLTSVTLRAQPGPPHYTSLQWTVASSDSIVRGTIEDVVPLNPGDSFTVFYEVSVKVRETLSGPAHDSLRFVAESDNGLNAQLKSSGHEALLFLGSSKIDFNRLSLEYFFTRNPVICLHAIDLDDKATPVVSFSDQGLNRISGRDNILAEVRTSLSYDRTIEPSIPFSLHEPTRREPDNFEAFTTVPLNRRLWRIGQNWSKPGSDKERVGKEIRDAFVRTQDYDEAKKKFAADKQVPTPRRPINSLSIDPLEWMAADSDLVVRGTIDDAVLLKLGDPDNRNDYLSTLDLHFVKLRVTEVLKGDSDGSVSFLVENGGELSKWQKQKTLLLVFLKDNRLEGIEPPVRAKSQLDSAAYDVLRYTARDPGTASIIAFEKPHLPILSMDLKWLNDPDAMLKVARRYLNETSAAKQTHRRSVPSFSFQPRPFFTAGTQWTKEPYARITLPIDPYLEKRARQWIASDKKEQRWLGAAALAYFKSDENARLLKSLLNDPARWDPPILVSQYNQPDPSKRVEHLIRWEAWIILHAWGSDAEKPSFNSAPSK